MRRLKDACVTQRLPIPGQDDDTWGAVLNGYLGVSHNPDGTLQPSALTAAGGYVKPATGVPASDLDTATQTNLTLASTALQLGGDIGGTSSTPRIVKLQGTVLNAASPSPNQVLAYSSISGAWVPSTVSSSTVNDATTAAPGIIQLAGDIAAGTATAPEVTSTHLTSALPINQGGTGQVTQAAALTALAGSQTPGTYLRSDGTNTTLSSIQAADVPVLNQSTTGNAATATLASTVTTNANLTGDITSVGNATTLTSSGNVESIISNNTTVAAKAPLVSPALTGTPTAPTATTGTNTTQLATTAFVASAVTSSATPNATTSTPGIVQLSGGLGGTYTAPTLLNQAGPVFNVKDPAYGAKGDGSTDDTTAIQNAINAANTAGAVVYFPSGHYRVSQLTLLTGTILQGVSSGTYPGDDGISGVSVLERIANTNLDLLLVPDGNNYGRIYDLAIDGNKNNNTAGYGLNIVDGASGQESQWIIERCFFQSNPNSNIYLGNNRRANKVQYGVFNYSGTGDGITVTGSDNTIMNCIIGTNARAGINLGTTTSQNWASFGDNLNATTTHIFNNDIYGNLVGICIPQNATRTMVVGNGIDRNSYQGITVYNVDCNTILSNAFHSNGQAANNTYGHIDLASGVTNVTMEGNTFGPLDGGFTNVCSYCVTLQTGITSGVITGNIGVYDSSDTVNGLISAAGSNSSPSVRLSNAGAIIQAGQSSQQAFQVRNTSGATLFEVSNGGSMNLLSGAAVFANPQNVWGGNNSNLAVANTTATFLSTNSTVQTIATVESAGQSANIATFYASNGTTALAQIDKSGGISVLGPTGATAGARFAGGTTSGAPSSGTFSVGDFVIDQTGAVWVCTAAGTPGTWVATSSKLVAPVTLPTGADANKGLVIKGNSATQSADLFEVQDGTPSTRVSVNSNYALTMVTASGVGQTVYQSFRGGDTNAGFAIGERGFMSWGSGSAASDTNLSRAAAGVLNVNAALSVTGLTGAIAASRYAGATASGAPTTGTFVVGDFVIDHTGAIWICTTAGTPGTWTVVGGSGGGGATLSANTFTGNQTAPAFGSSGLGTNVNATSRYVGATTSGAPTGATTTFVVGDFVVDQSGKVWICVTAGAPGTWVPVGTGTGSVAPSLHNFAAMNLDPAVVNTSTAPAASTHYVFKVVAEATQTVSKASFVISTTAGVGCSGWYASLYTSSGNLITGSTSSSDQGASFNATGTATATFGASVSVVAGQTYYISLGVGTATTLPTIARISNGIAGNVGLSSGVASATSPRWGTAANAYSAGVAPATLGTISTQATTWFAAIG